VWQVYLQATTIGQRENEKASKIDPMQMGYSKAQFAYFSLPFLSGLIRMSQDVIEFRGSGKASAIWNA
jgi:hypothetical protein